MKNIVPLLWSDVVQPHYFKYFGPTARTFRPLRISNHEGFWSFKTYTEFYRYYANWGRDNPADGDIHVRGKVAHYGTVIEHEVGWRSSKIAIIELSILRKYVLKVAALEDRYQCEVLLI